MNPRLPAGLRRNRIAIDSHTGDADVVQRPTGHGEGTGQAGGVVRRAVKGPIGWRGWR